MARRGNDFLVCSKTVHSSDQAVQSKAVVDRGQRFPIDGITVAQTCPDASGTIRQVRGMKVKFILTMEDLIVDEMKVDRVILDWETDIDQGDILKLSHEWITSQNFLTQRMVGLTRVGESSLTIEPMENTADV